MRDSLGESSGMSIFSVPVLLLAVGRAVFSHPASREGPAGCASGERNDTPQSGTVHGTFSKCMRTGAGSNTYVCSYTNICTNADLANT